ncbi:PCMD domain-containing protein [Bacteroides sp.]|uniref:PCMD domain-containing protein n=1 Tax=Bacteroides sp. TaxID=29523 RepID=UPI001B588CBA|nr:PCMD domain-containing protein [Bacteroides sp.]MBP6064369.1 PCMD domain-containing protein [Bacteroides sp.]MBP6067020.1 PCMD domain-containing protein [Bacteroides sp.]MBP6936029.1 PCMD domain-containing protein [Bacteroides sp.]MBP8622716.1 PCMD domain-containing protein [Bacteroides sp.]MBP9507119.1 PCMD domain-containing protein [Bacteroides sp.]
MNIQKIARRFVATGAFIWCCAASVLAQHKVEPIPFGNMDQWVTREIKESGIIGGNTKKVYAIGPTQTISSTDAYKNLGGSPWATSNVMAKVAGVTKTNTSVFPEVRGNGYCARLDTRMESVKVFGLVDITVLAAGSMFLGTVHEPIKGTKNPNKMLQMGIPFTKKPIALQFDYKVKMSDRENRIRATGFSKITDVPGRDLPAAILFLQKRWEDAQGNVFAKRVGTLVVHYYNTTDWRNNATYEILYGNITGHPSYKAHQMRLQVDERYTLNSKGLSVPIREVAWADEGEVPTHLILQFTSSHGGAYVGSPGNSLWIDNVKLVY